MGSSSSILDDLLIRTQSNEYYADRYKLRESLNYSFDVNPDNQDIIHKITALQDLVTAYPDICSTAARELVNKDENAPTNSESAYRELERLYHVYETGRILRSVKCRLGPAACPLGHHMAKFNNRHPAKIFPNCNICDTSEVKLGYHCSYCSYNVCDRCQPVLCCNGHTMKLWTHPESQHSCVVCRKDAITSGYRCLECRKDYNICDICTYKPGRIVVRKQIYDRMVDDFNFMAAQSSESETALRLKNDFFDKSAFFKMTTMEMHQERMGFVKLKEIVIAEVLQTRLTREIIRLRTILIVGPMGEQYSVMAWRESKQKDNFVESERVRLQLLVDEHERTRSVVERSEVTVACLLGHALYPYKGTPKIYADRGVKLSPQCRICSRYSPEGFHCWMCEYDLCKTCSVIYCSECHVTTMWTVPEASATCHICKAEGLTMGYHCLQCNIETCDACTRKEVRDDLRRRWELEMADLLDFLKAHRSQSDEAAYFTWRQHNYIVSPGLLCDNVLELRVAKARAIKQIKYKDFIDKIKLIRRQLSQFPNLSQMASREGSRSNNYYFNNRKEARAELKRLLDIDERCNGARTVPFRLVARIACPLGHGMVPMRKEGSHSAKEVREEPSGGEAHQPSISTAIVSRPGTAASQKSLNPVDFLSVNTKVATLAEIANNALPTVVSGHPPLCLPCDSEYAALTCRVCASSCLNGNSCPICEYTLCQSCSVVFCRQGHQAQIWTLPEAQGLSCDACKQVGITSGYRCTTCQVDLCDACTVKESRDALKQWPYMELKRLLHFMEVAAETSALAREFVDGDPVIVNKQKVVQQMSMTALCSKIFLIKALKAEIDKELGVKRLVFERENYAKTSGDL